MKTAITVTVRLKSTRLPRKALLKIKGKSMIEHLIERLKQSKLADMIIICTSTNPRDDELIPIAKKMGINYFRGDEEDVLKRLYNAAISFGVNFIVSTTGDNPLTDPTYIDKIIQKFQETNSDYISVLDLPWGTFSYGLKIQALKEILELKKESDTEVWGYYFTETGLFRTLKIEVEEELKHPELRLTVDTTEDFQLIEKIFDDLYEKDEIFNLKKVINLLTTKKHYLDINKNIKQKIFKKPNLDPFKIIKINNKNIGENKPVFIIAEAGVNHNGNVELAKKLVDVAFEAGADAVKFQTFKSEDLVTKDASMASYQEKNVGKKESQQEMLKKLELSESDFVELKNYCDKKKIIFFSTPHTDNALDFLDKIVPAFKIGSGDLTNLPFLEKVAKKNKPIILSTGMANMTEVKEVLDILKKAGNDKVVMLHCTTNYPCPFEEANLKAMKNMKDRLDCLVGYSDHTEGVQVPVMAVTLGAVVIEKHFTLDKSLPGPDHKASLNPQELKEMIKQIRLIKLIKGEAEKKPNKSEEKISQLIRKSVVAAQDIPEGKIITNEMLAIKRPGMGLNPSKIVEVVGKISKRNIQQDELIKLEDLK